VFVTVLPSEPVDTTSFYKNALRPALAAIRLSASRRATTAPDGARVPAVRAFGFKTYGHTFATMQLSAGTHFMQVSKWLGHSSYMLTLSTYADYIREDATAAPNLARPVAAPATNVVDLERRKSDTA
jgi:integrase